MVFQQERIQFDHGLGVHPDGLVDDHELGYWEPLPQLLEQGVGQVHVVGTVRHVRAHLGRGEVLAPLTQCVDNLSALLPQLVVLRQCLEAAAHSGLVCRPCHRQRVEPQLGVDAELPREDGPVEQGVVAEDRLVAIVQRLQELTRVVASVGIHWSVVDLDPNTDDLEARVADVRFSGDLG